MILSNWRPYFARALRRRVSEINQILTVSETRRCRLLNFRAKNRHLPQKCPILAWIAKIAHYVLFWTVVSPKSPLGGNFGGKPPSRSLYRQISENFRNFLKFQKVSEIFRILKIFRKFLADFGTKIGQKSRFIDFWAKTLRQLVLGPEPSGSEFFRDPWPVVWRKGRQTCYGPTVQGIPCLARFLHTCRSQIGPDSIWESNSLVRGHKSGNRLTISEDLKWVPILRPERARNRLKA